MARYLVEALPLGKEAVERRDRGERGHRGATIGMFAVCSCTGYVTPGLDILLARDLGMPAGDAAGVHRPHGLLRRACPGSAWSSDFVAARGRPALLLCVELTEPARAAAATRMDTQQIVAHALFSDAAAAVVVVPGERPGYAVREVAAVTDTADGGPHDLGGDRSRVSGWGCRRRCRRCWRARAGLVEGLLARHGLRLADVDGWAVHPGGPRILDVVERELGLPEAGAGRVPSDPGRTRQLLVADRPVDSGAINRRHSRSATVDSDAGLRSRPDPLRGAAGTALGELMRGAAYRPRRHRSARIELREIAAELLDRGAGGQHAEDRGVGVDQHHAEGAGRRREVEVVPAARWWGRRARAPFRRRRTSAAARDGRSSR